MYYLDIHKPHTQGWQVFATGGFYRWFLTVKTVSAKTSGKNWQKPQIINFYLVFGTQSKKHWKKNFHSNRKWQKLAKTLILKEFLPPKATNAGKNFHFIRKWQKLAKISIFN